MLFQLKMVYFIASSSFFIFFYFETTIKGIIMDNSRRWSLFVDPQVQAANWIRKMEKKNNLEVLKFSFPDYMKRLEYCIPLGYPVLIENIEEILEAPLDPLLYKQTFKQGGGLLIQLGENVIEYHKNFKLYLTSKMRNPHYLPEIFNKVTIINFALTLTGLQDQLLGKYCVRYFNLELGRLLTQTYH